MILDDSVVHFLRKTEPLYIHLAVANSEGRSYSVGGFGVQTNEGKDQLKIFILKSQAKKVLSFIHSGSGRISSLLTDGFTNESYQIKGSYIESKLCTEEDNEFLSRYRKGSLKLFPKMYDKFPLSATICDSLSYYVEQVYVQTPGPYAGSRYEKGVDTHDT
ncbi:hypothetical protein [Neobacillus rhizophilus]|uniref:Uncharacterized protein n=1 Tax=Neobacillus rhizophilus TaxID=2833579 RepID=A0A942U0L5_9BACI|nr:hypothetical protein [Neobacillus rhizophilus]MBS4211070.1 hypothetical protein [Neobacillus rhizophilus]